MIINYRGDIFDSDVNGILHQANLHHTFGSGIAAQIKAKFPDAYKADLETKEGDYHKLGTFSHARQFSNASQRKIDIFNIYSQIGFRTVGNQCATHYPSVFTGMLAVKEYINLIHPIRYKLGHPIKYKLGIPYKYGSGLAGGDWTEILKIIGKVFDTWGYDAVICRREED